MERKCSVAHTEICWLTLVLTVWRACLCCSVRLDLALALSGVGERRLPLAGGTDKCVLRVCVCVCAVLYGPYDPRCWFYEVIELARKVLLTGIMAADAAITSLYQRNSQTHTRLSPLHMAGFIVFFAPGTIALCFCCMHCVACRHVNHRS